MGQYLARKKNARKIRVSDDPAVAFFHHVDQRKANFLAHTSETGDALPGSLVVPPGIYCFCGASYPCDYSGLYRFSKPQRANRQRVVYANDDPINFALSLSLLSIRGNRDDCLSEHKLRDEAGKRLLSLTCGPLSRFCITVLQSYGVSCREVGVHTLEQSNSYNNGHTLVEVWDPGKDSYVLVDVDKKCLYKEHGRHLNLIELVHSYKSGNHPEIVCAANASMVDFTNFVERSSGFNYQFLEMANYSSGVQMHANNSRLSQVPIIYCDNRPYLCSWNADVNDKFMNIYPDAAFLSVEEFVSKFYSRTNR